MASHRRAELGETHLEGPIIFTNKRVECDLDEFDVEPTRKPPAGAMGGCAVIKNSCAAAKVDVGDFGKSRLCSGRTHVMGCKLTQIPEFVLFFLKRGC
jgi:hypothetical protein